MMRRTSCSFLLNILILFWILCFSDLILSQESIIINNLTLDCLSTPWDPSCKDFTLSDSDSNKFINYMCIDMYMAGCTIRNICNDAKYQNLYPSFCNPFSIYKEMCLDMPRMNDCDTFLKMCPSNTSITQCNITTLPNLLSTRTYNDLIKSICTTMDMDGCSDCLNKSCDKLTVFSNLCLQMDMKQCSSWHGLCSNVPKWPICSEGNSLIPSMKMYFHTGINEYFFLQQWVPQNDGQYVLALILTFIASVGYEFLKLWRNRIGKNYQREKSFSPINEHPNARAGKISYVLKSSTVYFVEITVGFLVMLLIMTYNVSLCITIVVGRYIGAIICGMIDDYTPDTTNEVECH